MTLLTLWFFSMSAAGDMGAIYGIASRETSYDHKSILQLDNSLFPKESLEIIASCEVKETHHFNTTDYTISNVCITLMSRRPGYGNNSIIHTYKDKKTYQAIGLTALLPSWRGQYVPSEKFVLPSARLHKVGDDILYVIFSGSDLTVYSLSGNADIKTRTKAIPPKQIPSLLTLWKTTFSSHDVYWSYYLVAESRRFGLSKRVMVNHADFVDTAYLDKLYTELIPDCR